MMGIDRQKLIGWGIVLFAGGSLLYLFKMRLLTAGPPLERKEWMQGIGMFLLLMVGSVNIRMAAMRDEQKKRARLQSKGDISP